MFKIYWMLCHGFKDQRTSFYLLYIRLNSLSTIEVYDPPCIEIEFCSSSFLSLLSIVILFLYYHWKEFIFSVCTMLTFSTHFIRIIVIEHKNIRLILRNITNWNYYHHIHLFKILNHFMEACNETQQQPLGL